MNFNLKLMKNSQIVVDKVKIQIIAMEQLLY